jgi:hypothetical protein
MAALKKSQVAFDSSAKAKTSPESIRVVAEDHDIEPTVSPAHQLQQALHNAGYRSENFRERPMSNAMLVLTLVCVYALAMMMMLGTFTA